MTVWARLPIDGRPLVCFRSCTGYSQLAEHLEQYGLCDFYVYDGRRILAGDDPIQTVTVNVCLRLRGGKGGFGSNLRAQGNRLSSRKRSGNFESCVDLATGKRLRDIRREKLIAEYLEREPELKKEEERVKQEHAEEREDLLRKRRMGVLKGRDLKFMKECRETANKIEDLVQTALLEQTIGRATERVPPQVEDPNNAGASKKETKHLSKWEEELLFAEE